MSPSYFIQSRLTCFFVRLTSGKSLFPVLILKVVAKINKTTDTVKQILFHNCVTFLHRAHAQTAGAAGSERAKRGKSSMTSHEKTCL